MYGFHRILAASAGLLALTLVARGASAQGFPMYWKVAGPANWNSNSNWAQDPDFIIPGIVPAAADDAYADISNGGVAFVQDTPVPTGGIILGAAAGQFGTLEIRNGGNLTAEATAITNGNLTAGQGGVGIARILNGGTLNVVTVSSGGEAGSEIEISGNGQLIAAGSMNLNAITDIQGQSANLSAQSITFGASSNLMIDIAGSAAPLIKTTGGVVLNGALNIDFGGSTPTPGSTWNLFDTAGIVNQFAQINPSTGPLPMGQRLRIRSVADAGSMNGVYGQLVLEQLLVLEVDRDNGTVKIVNPSTTSSVELEGYSITSGTNAAFNPADTIWESLEDQGVSGWIEANPKTTALNELDTNADTSVGPNGELDLGTPYQPQFAQIGQNFENIAFTYEIDGETISAPVIFTGAHTNDMTLFVDGNGEAQIRNASDFTVDIEGYTIRSASMSLEPGGLDSFEENAELANWLEANPTEAAISELKTAGVETLSSHEAYNIGQIFDTLGMQDLVFQYYLAGQSTPTLGRVVYQALPDIVAGLDGDYNNDGVVDAADYVLWRKNPAAFGGAPGYTTWRANFGETSPGAGAGSGSTLAAAPEPGTVSLLFLAIATVGVVARRKS